LTPKDTENELEHLIEIFGSEIDHDVIKMCFESSNHNYEETVLGLSCMVSQKDMDKPKPESPKEVPVEGPIGVPVEVQKRTDKGIGKEEHKKQPKYVPNLSSCIIFRKSLLGLTSTSKIFIPNKGLVDEGKKEEEDKQEEDKVREEDVEDPGREFKMSAVHFLGAIKTNNPFTDLI